MPHFPSTIWHDLEGARRGEASAWRSVVARYWPAVYGYLRGVGQSNPDAEDITQEVFLQMVRSEVLTGAHPARGRFRSLVLAVTCNVLKHRVRDGRAEKRGGGRQPAPIDGLELAEPQVSEEFDREWVGRMVASALEELSLRHPAYHQALKMVLAERTQAEIAGVLGKSVAQVNNHVHRARDWMKKRLKSLVLESCADAEAYREELAYLGRYLDFEEA